MGDWYNRNLPCFGCGSSDAMQESEYHYKCFSCGQTFKKKEKNLTECLDQIVQTGTSYMNGLLQTGKSYGLPIRKLTLATAEKFRITCTKYTGMFHDVSVNNHWVFVFNQYKDGKLITQKIRSTTDKSFMKMLGDTNGKDFYGQWLFPPNAARKLIITEGEFDAAAIYQATGFAVVSVRNGSSSLLTNCRHNIDWLSRWGGVVLAMDNDKAGMDAVEQCLSQANLFTPGRVQVVRWPEVEFMVDGQKKITKDANDMLLAGLEMEIKKIIWDAEEWHPKDILTVDDCLDEVLIKPQLGVNTPWSGLTSALMGWRFNTINTFAGADGLGKTELADEIIHELVVNQKQKVWIYSCEQEPEETIRRQVGKILQLPLHLPGQKWDEKQITTTSKVFINKLYMWRPEKSVTTEDFFAKMKYASIAYGTKYFLLDHLKGIESQLQDPIRGMGKFICDLKGFVKTHKVCAILFSHVAKDKKQTKAGQTDESWNSGRVPTKENIFGSSGITAWSDNIIGLSRNVESADAYEASITRLTILKNRLMGNRSQRVVYLQYLNDCGKLIEVPSVDYEAKDEQK